MAGIVDRITGRLKRAAGDLSGDAELQREGVQEERKADAKEDLERAQRQVDRAADEVARLERESNRQRGPEGPGAGAGSPEA